MSEDERQLLEAYAESGMRVKSVAEELHFDRRTVHRKLAMIKKKTGHDPLEFHGLAALLGYERRSNDTDGD